MNEPYVLSVVIPLYLAGALLFRYFSITKSKYPHAKTSTLRKNEKKKKKTNWYCKFFTVFSFIRHFRAITFDAAHTQKGNLILEMNI